MSQYQADIRVRPSAPPQPIDDQAVRDSFLSGVYERATVETTAFNLEVSGALPPELRGRYLRLGPNPVAEPNPAKFDWLAGEGMMHGVRISDGVAGWYRNRFMRTPQNARDLNLPDVPLPPGRQLGASNTSPLVHRGLTYATMEGGSLPLRLSDELESIEAFDFEGALKGGFSGHCKIDPVTGEIVAIVYDVMGWLTSKLMPHLLVIDADGRVTREQPFEVETLTLMHDCWITERFAVVYELPVRIATETFGTPDEIFFTWDAAVRARIGLIDRRGPAAAPIWFDVEPCGILHTLNAYDDGDKVVLEGFRFDRLFDQDKVSGAGDSPSYLHRWTLDLQTGRSTEQALDTHPGELPMVDPRRLGRENRYSYWLGFELGDHNKSGNRQLAWTFDTLCKLDRSTGDIIRVRAPEGHAYGELSFVPRAPDAAEDDGWLVGFRYRLDGGPTDLVVLPAQSLTSGPVAVVHLPVRAPMGFHGSWAPEAFA